MSVCQCHVSFAAMSIGESGAWPTPSIACHSKIQTIRLLGSWQLVNPLLVCKHDLRHRLIDCGHLAFDELLSLQSARCHSASQNAQVSSVSSRQETCRHGTVQPVAKRVRLLSIEKQLRFFLESRQNSV